MAPKSVEKKPLVTIIACETDSKHIFLCIDSKVELDMKGNGLRTKENTLAWTFGFISSGHCTSCQAQPELSIPDSEYDEAIWFLSPRIFKSRESISIFARRNDHRIFNPFKLHLEAEAAMLGQSRGEQRGFAERLAQVRPDLAAGLPPPVHKCAKMDIRLEEERSVDLDYILSNGFQLLELLETGRTRLMTMIEVAIRLGAFRAYIRTENKLTPLLVEPYYKSGLVFKGPGQFTFWNRNSRNDVYGTVALSPETDSKGGLNFPMHKQFPCQAPDQSIRMIDATLEPTCLPLKALIEQGYEVKISESAGDEAERELDNEAKREVGEGEEKLSKDVAKITPFIIIDWVNKHTVGPIIVSDSAMSGRIMPRTEVP